MDGMPLKPWSVENSHISDPSGMMTTDPLLMSQNRHGVESRMHNNLFSMDGMLLQPWNMYLDAIDGEGYDSTTCISKQRLS
jgi:hypothetical protein